jgi:hypothetical protein
VITANTESTPIADKWDPSKHTDLENAMCSAIKWLITQVWLTTDLEDIKKALPILWGNE